MALTRSLPTARGALAPLRLRPSPCALRPARQRAVQPVERRAFTRFGYSAAHVVANPFAAEIFSMLD